MGFAFLWGWCNIALFAFGFRGGRFRFGVVVGFAMIIAVEFGRLVFGFVAVVMSFIVLVSGFGGGLDSWFGRLWLGLGFLIVWVLALVWVCGFRG